MSQGRITGRESGLFEPKFDIALNLRPARLLLRKLLNNYDDRTTKLIRVHCANYKKLTVNVKVIGLIILNLFNYKRLRNDNALIKYLKISLAVTSLQEWHLFRYGSDVLQSELEKLQQLDDFKISNLPEMVKVSFEGVNDMDKAVEHYKNVSFKTDDHLDRLKLSRHFNCSSLSCSFTFIRNYIICKVEGFLFLISKDQFLMIHNKIFEIFNVLLISYLLSGICWTAGFYNRSVNILYFMCEHILDKENDAYELFKSFDGLA